MQSGRQLLAKDLVLGVRKSRLIDPLTFKNLFRVIVTIHVYVIKVLFLATYLRFQMLNLPMHLERLDLPYEKLNLLNC